MEPIPPISQPPIQPPVSPFVPPPPQVKKSSKLLFLLLILIFLAASSVFAYKYYQLKQQLAQPSPIPSATTIPKTDLTADWKTYTNTEFGFEVKYAPNNEPLENTGPGNTTNIISFGSMKNNGFDIEISAVHDLNYYKKLITETIDKEEKITVNGVTGDKLTYKQVIVIDELAVSQTIVRMNDYDYIITALASDIDQILSTFKFIDQVKMLSSISSLFNKINQNIGESVSPILVSMDYFYSGGIYSTKKVWQLDLTQFDKDKTKMTQIINTIDQFQLKDSGGSGEGGGNYVYTYTNSDMDCTLASQNSIVKLSCATK